MANQVTVTAKTGPAVANTSKVITCDKVVFDLKGQKIQMFNGDAFVADFDLVSLASAITCTITSVGTTGATYAFTIS